MALLESRPIRTSVSFMRRPRAWMRSWQKSWASRSRSARAARRDRSVAVAWRRIRRTGAFPPSRGKSSKRAPTVPMPTPQSVSVTTTSPRRREYSGTGQYWDRAGPPNSTRATRAMDTLLPPCDRLSHPQEHAFGRQARVGVSRHGALCLDLGREDVEDRRKWIAGCQSRRLGRAVGADERRRGTLHLGHGEVPREAGQDREGGLP